MSAPGPADAAQEFVVHTDRAAIRSRHGGILLLHGLLAAAAVLGVLWFSGLDLGPYAALPMLILLVGQMVQLSYHSFVYGRRVAVSQPLVLNHWGFSMNTTAGRMEVPWEAVTGLQIQRRLWFRVLVIQLHPAAGPGMPGIETDIPASTWRRMQRLGGPMLGEKGIREPLEDIQQAAKYFSRGRVPAGR